MDYYKMICNESKTLSSNNQAKVLELMHSLQNKDDDGSSGSVSAVVDDTASMNVTDYEMAGCPHCSGYNVIRFDHKRRKQCFFCKDCQKSFMPTTGTIMENSHFDKSIWTEVISDTLDGLVFIDKTAERLGMTHDTVFHMRHKILIAIEGCQKEEPTHLKDISELDETYVLECFKGKKFGDDAPRSPRKHGAKASKRGISDEWFFLIFGIYPLLIFLHFLHQLNNAKYQSLEYQSLRMNFV